MSMIDWPSLLNGLAGVNSVKYDCQVYTLETEGGPIQFTPAGLEDSEGLAPFYAKAIADRIMDLKNMGAM